MGAEENPMMHCENYESEVSGEDFFTINCGNTSTRERGFAEDGLLVSRGNVGPCVFFREFS